MFTELINLRWIWIELPLEYSVSKLEKIFTWPVHKLLSSSFAIISYVYRSIIRNKLHLLGTVLVDFKAAGSFKTNWVRQYLVNVTDLAGIVNATVYKTDPIFTGLRYGKLS